MQIGDFSSLVQLGVGIHLGTALLQMYGEIGLQPMIRSVDRLKDVVDDPENPAAVGMRDDLNEIISRYGVFRIRMFNEYKKMLTINSIVAGVLIALLIGISFATDTVISPCWGVPIAALSILPAPITLFALWFDASRELAPLLAKARGLESRMIG